MDTKSSRVIGIIGTGNYAMTLTKKLTSIGYHVLLGSRDPSRRESTLYLAGKCLCGVEVTSIPRCIQQCDIIFVAIHMDDYKTTLSRFSNLARDKVLVDISNRRNRYAKISNAERLANIMSYSFIVKAFNTVASSSLDQTAPGTKTKIYVASDDKVAKQTMIDLVQRMGFVAVDFGGLKSALYLEDFVLKIFTGWKIPIFLTFGIFNMWCLYIIYIYFIVRTAYKWEQIFLKIVNKPLCMTAITMVALTYLPGQLASILQVCYGTKHRQFPKFIDGWLKSRRQMGIIAYVLVAFHVIASTLMMSPTYYRSWYHLPQVTIPSNFTLTATKITLPVSTSWMVWKGEAALFFGITAFLVMSILAITSIPSVADSLNWSEWRFVHSQMGTGLLMLSACHVIVMGAPGWKKGGICVTLQSITFLSVILPVIVLLLKITFWLPPLRSYLQKIRRGWERESYRVPTNDFAISHNDVADLESGMVEKFDCPAFGDGGDETERLMKNSLQEGKSENVASCSCSCKKEIVIPMTLKSSAVTNTCTAIDVNECSFV